MGNDTDDFKAGEEKGMILGELKSINQRLDNIDNSFSEFKAGAGVRIEEVEKQIDGLQTKMCMVLWVGSKIFTPVLSAIGLGLIAMIAWQYFKK